MSETYEEWISDQKLPSHDDYYLSGEDLEFVWDYQQTKIEDLKSKLNKAVEALEFYEKKERWTLIGRGGLTGEWVFSFMENIEGGKIARQALEEINQDKE